MGIFIDIVGRALEAIAIGQDLTRVNIAAGQLQDLRCTYEHSKVAGLKIKYPVISGQKICRFSFCRFEWICKHCGSPHR